MIPISPSLALFLIAEREGVGYSDPPRYDFRTNSYRGTLGDGRCFRFAAESCRLSYEDFLKTVEQVYTPYPDLTTHV